jgi:hypothetical protein
MHQPKHTASGPEVATNEDMLDSARGFAAPSKFPRAANSILAYTYNGDADLGGEVGFADFTRLGANFSKHPPPPGARETSITRTGKLFSEAPDQRGHVGKRAQAQPDAARFPWH